MNEDKAEYWANQNWKQLNEISGQLSLLVEQFKRVADAVECLVADREGQDSYERESVKESLLALARHVHQHNHDNGIPIRTFDDCDREPCASAKQVAH